MGEEIAEVGRFPGRWLRALGRTVEGRGVAALVAPAEPGGDAAAELALELAALEPAFGTKIVRLAYRAGSESPKPLEVRRLAPGESLP